MQRVRRMGQRLLQRLARHDHGDGAGPLGLGDVFLGEVKDLHVAAHQLALVLIGRADQAALGIELDQVMIESVDRGAVPPAQEVLTFEVDLGDQQASEMKGTHRCREAAIGRVPLERLDVEDDRDALAPGFELVARAQRVGREG